MHNISQAFRAKPDWHKKIFKFTLPNPFKAKMQLLNTFIPYFILWAVMIYMANTGMPYWTILAVAFIAALFLVRIFIFFHDCCHGSFFPSKRANVVIGYITGVLTFTPYEAWRCSHGVHHVTAGDLDRRGTGDVWTLTRDEYVAAKWWKRFAYRIYRNPFFMLGFGPAFVFLLENRFFTKKSDYDKRKSVILTNLYILAIVIAAGFTMGLRTYLVIQLPVILMAGSMGIWLFYVQHQFKGVYWARHEEWDPMQAALQGASFLKLPKVLQWFSGNIGLHFIHHLRPSIPNYHLQQCYLQVPVLQTVRPLSFRNSIQSLMLNLWDEKAQKMISFRALKKM